MFRNILSNFFSFSTFKIWILTKTFFETKLNLIFICFNVGIHVETKRCFVKLKKNREINFAEPINEQNSVKFGETVIPSGTNERSGTMRPFGRDIPVMFQPVAQNRRLFLFLYDFYATANSPFDSAYTRSKTVSVLFSAANRLASSQLGPTLFDSAISLINGKLSRKC